MPPAPLRCAGALTADHDGRLLLRHRPPERSLSPKPWDIIDDHPGPGEGVVTALDDRPHAFAAALRSTRT
ncbi:MULTISPECIES: hypothetical protein [unclassified Micromonospora]|uniref:hypothetical protein n=1 Tax=unclassified Micromonospora TaxID=2617518 RepID=UPI002FF0E158